MSYQPSATGLACVEPSVPTIGHDPLALKTAGDRERHRLKRTLFVAGLGKPPVLKDAYLVLS